VRRDLSYLFIDVRYLFIEKASSYRDPIEIYVRLLCNDCYNPLFLFIYRRSEVSLSKHFTETIALFTKGLSLRSFL